MDSSTFLKLTPEERPDIIMKQQQDLRDAHATIRVLLTENAKLRDENATFRARPLPQQVNLNRNLIDRLHDVIDDAAGDYDDYEYEGG